MWLVIINNNENALRMFILSLQTSQMFEALKQTVWYYWNNINKKIFLMLLINGEKVFKVQFTQNVSLNYELGVSVSKVLVGN